MAARWVLLPALALALLGPGRAGAALNLQELSDLKYGIEIAAEPVLAGQSRAEDVVTISSKYKQKYECRLPPAAIKIHREPEDDPRGYSGLGIMELLRPMGAAPCLRKTKDWWTYEFCYGRHIQQYHIEESEIKGDVLYLGYYQSAFDWDNETAKASKQHRLKRYHSQTYVNGSKCDLNGRAREAEVRFLCEEGSGDYIARVDEPQSCSYVLTVHTTRICHHPFLRPPAAATPQPIRCQPALSPAQYLQYVQAQVSDTKRKVEEISEELRTLDTRLWSEQDPSPAKPPPREDPSLDGEPSAPSPAENAGPRDPPPTADDPLDPTKEEEPTVKAPDGPLADFHRKIHFKAKAKAADLSPEPPEPEEVTAGPEPPEEEQDEAEAELLGAFEKELQELLPGARSPRLGAEVRARVEKEFDNILDEVEDELETEGLKGEFDRTRASKSLASTLNKLIDRLDTGTGAPKGHKEEEEAEDDISPATKPEADGTDERVRVRVTRVRPGSTLQKELRVREQGNESPRLRHLEREVRDLLDREGLKAEGKIEIKIMTPGGFGDEDDAHWLSDEDTRHLKDIFFNILIQGTEEAHKERRRQQQLEDNYRLVWGRRQDDPPVPTSADPEEPDF
ncbi:protein OS-9 isoform X2 [Alligator mississippiensis]|uniref:protein OS-9 isoform X2 n=1 Tax=Alligator mississippiensis TaxID=8496 RepID=UPI002877F80A|nr:protein OS-9 isoform X2 [Alligator mississippiensis]